VQEPAAASQLAEAAIQGDRAAMSALWREYRRWVAAVLIAHKPHDVDLDDLLQDVALTFVRSVGDVRDGRSVVPWLRTVAVNAARAAARGPERRRRVPWSSLMRRPDAGGPAAADPRDADDSARRLLELAARLPDGYREPLLLKAVRGLSYRQIGEIMDLPETTVETRIARARRQLRDLARADAGRGTGAAANPAAPGAGVDDAAQEGNP